MSASLTTRVGGGALLLLLLLLGIALFELGYGQVRLSAGEAWAALTGAQGTDPVMIQIVREIRLPRVLTGIAAGCALGIAGVLMQTLFRNPMADAWSLGLTAGGQLGVALIATGSALAGPGVVAFLSVFGGLDLTAGAAIGVALMAAAMAALARRVSAVTLLVVGLMIGFTAQGIVSVTIHFANRAGAKLFAGWNDGNFASVTWPDLPFLALPVLIGVVVAIACAKPLTSLLLGETYAESLGTDVPRLRRLTLAATVLLVAPVTAYCGPVTFVGLIVPHLARWIAGTSRILPLLPLAALGGAVLAMAADAVMHLPWEQHFLHLNAVLALVGAPVVIGLLIFSPTMRGQR